MVKKTESASQSKKALLLKALMAKKKKQIKKEKTPQLPSKKTKIEKIEKVEKKIEKQETKKTVQKRIQKKIEDFNKFHQEREKEIQRFSKELQKFIELKKKNLLSAIGAIRTLDQKEKEKDELFGVEDGFVYIEVTLNKLPEHFSIRPVQM